jgi:transposase-like protein
MNCTKCNSVKNVKSGIIKCKQRFKCKDCGCNFTVEIKSTSKSKSLKKDALHLYLEGLGFRSIGRFLNVSHVSVYNWIRTFGREVANLQSNEKIEIVELDEMHTYIQQKKTTVGFGLLWIGLGKNSSTLFAETDQQKPLKTFGKV